MSTIFATAIIAAITAKDPRPRKGLSRAIVGMLAFNALYMILVAFVYLRIS